MIAAAAWQHVAAVAFSAAIGLSTANAASTRIGAAGIALAWIGSMLLVASTVGVVLLRLSINALDRLTDGESESYAVNDGDE